MTITWGECGHPLRDPSLDGAYAGYFCRVCHLLAFKSSAVTDKDDVLTIVARLNTRHMRRGREDEANAWEFADGSEFAITDEPEMVRFEDLDDRWRARVERQRRSGSPDEMQTNEALVANNAHLAGTGYTSNEVRATIARICPPASRGWSFRGDMLFGRPIPSHIARVLSTHYPQRFTSADAMLERFAEGFDDHGRVIWQEAIDAPSPFTPR